MRRFMCVILSVLSTEYYGNDGPIPVKTNMIPLLDVWFDAARELGYQVADPNGFQQEGW